VVLKSNERESKTRVLAEPEMERNVKGGLRESIARGTDLARSIRLARAINIRERRIGDVG